MMSRRLDEANATRADAPPSGTRGGPVSTGKLLPGSTIRPPSHARSGSIDVRESRDGDTRESVADEHGVTDVSGIFRSGAPHLKMRPTKGVRRPGLGIVELDVPVQVVAPAPRRVPQPDGDADRGSRIGPPRRPHELHTRLMRRAPPLLPIAGHAARDDVLPVLPAAFRHGHHVIECQIRGGEYVVAVLAGVIVTGVDVRA